MMKVREKRGTLKATRLFTDREEPRYAFWKNYDKCRESMRNGEGDIFVLCYYGIGGIGKSWLLEQLVVEMKEKLVKPHYVSFDFTTARDSRTVLENMKNMLTEQYRYNFPLFDIALYMYNLKIGKDASLPEVKSFIEKSPVLSFLLTVFGAVIIPEGAALAGIWKGIEGVLDAVGVVDKGQATIRNLLKKNRKRIREIDQLSPTEIYASLPLLFAEDLTNNLEDAEEPLVVFLDTYELLVNEMSLIGEPLGNDEWLRGEDGLIQHIPNVLWVIAGREKLKWERFDAEWRDALDQHILGNLSPADAEWYLRQSGVRDEQLRGELYELTNGTPQYLQLCVDRYEKLVENGNEPVIADFGNSVYALIERFVRYMDDSRKDIVYMLCIMKTWKDEMAMEVGAKVLPSFSIALYEKVKELSFVTDTDEGLFSVHLTVSDVLENNCPALLKENVLRGTMEFCQRKIREEIGIGEYDFYLGLLLKMGCAYYAIDALEDFYGDKIQDEIEEMCSYGRFESAKIIFRPFWQIAEKHQDSLLYAYACTEYYYILREEGRYREAHQLIQMSYELYKTLLGKDDEETLWAYASYETSLQDLGEYEEALVVAGNILNSRRTLLGENHNDTVIAMNDMAIALDFMGRYEEAYALLKSVYQKWKEFYGEEHSFTRSALLNLAGCLVKLGRNEEACEIEQSVYEERKALYGEEHPETINAKMNVAETLDSMKYHEKALRMKIEIYESLEKLYGEDHPDTMSAMENLAATLEGLDNYTKLLDIYRGMWRREEIPENPENSKSVDCIEIEEITEEQLLAERTLEQRWSGAEFYCQLQRYEEAYEEYEAIYEICVETLGEMHEDTIRTMEQLAKVLSALGQYNESYEMGERLLAVNRELLGDDHEYVLYIREELAQTLIHMEHYDEAKSLLKELLDEVKQTENREMICSVLDKMAYWYEYQEEYEEALPVYQTVYENRKEIYGEEDPDTIDTLDTMALLYFCVKDYEKALELYEKLYRVRKRILGETHVDTIRCMNDIAGIMARQERYKDALAWYRRVYETRMELLKGTEIKTLDDVELVWMSLGTDVGLELYKELYEKRKILFGEEAVCTIIARENMAYLLWLMEEYDEFLEVQGKVYETRKRLWGDEDIKTIECLEFLASGYGFSERKEEAVRLCEIAYGHRCRVQGEEAADAVNALAYIAMCYKELGEYEQASERYLKLYKIRKKILGIDHPDTMAAMRGFRRALEGFEE